MGSTDKLARFVLDTDFQDIPREAIELSKRLFLDCMGSALAAVGEPTGRIIQEYIKEIGATEEARLIGTSIASSAPNAAFANGVMAHAISFDDSAPSHPTVTILAAQVLGYDVFLRFNAATKRAETIRLGGWHPTGFFGTVAASAMTAKLLKLDLGKTRIAFGIAGSLSAGLSRNIGTMTMPLHAGNSARNGMVAALLAQKGFSADDEILEGQFGFLNALCGKDGYNIEELTSNFGSPFKVVSPGINIKFYPSCWAHHRAVDAMLHLIEKYNLSADEVESIECDLQLDKPMARYIHPKTDLQAKYSIGYNLAVALLDGKVGIEQFFPEKMFDAKTQEVLAKVKHVPQEWSKEGPDRHMVKVRLNDGREYSYGVEHCKGEAKAKPLTRDELLSKYRTCARRVLSEDKIERSIEIIDHIEDTENKPLYSYGSQGELLGDNYDTQVKTLVEKVKYLTGNDYIPENDLSLLYIQYISGYHESKNYGDILEIEGEKYIYIDSISLSNEMEHEAEDGGLVYEYRGYSFLRILQKLEKG